LRKGNWGRSALPLLTAGAIAAVLVSGGSSADPRTAVGLPGSPAPFLGTAVVGDGGLTAAIDAYGDVVDLRAPGPAGRALIDNPAARQMAGSVPADTGIVPRVRIGDGAALPMWRANSVSQRYLEGTNVLRTVARFGRVRTVITDAAMGEELARIIKVAAPRSVTATASLGIDIEAGSGLGCHQWHRPRRLELTCSWGRGAASAGAASGGDMVRTAEASDRRWLGRARPLGAAAPRWARAMHQRSLLTLRALTDRRTGAVAAGARDGWAYVWPRDAAAVALALDSSGYRGEAQRIVRLLLTLDLDAAARFDGNGEPVAGRGPEGDACGWVEIAARTTGRTSTRVEPQRRPHRRSSFIGICPTKDERRLDYQEGEPGDYLGNAIASPAGAPKGHLQVSPSVRRLAERQVRSAFASGGVLVREADDPNSEIDSAAAWAVRPFPHPYLYPLVHRTLLRLTEESGRYGILPSEDWSGGVDPWTAPTAWTAWSLVALGERRQALHLLGELRRAATRAGELPERVDVRTGVPRSTTPLAWSHAFAILALRQLWPIPRARS
jgi:hypothetical protein